MSNENKRNEYMKGAYANYWSHARNKVYGSMPYDHALIELVLAIAESQKSNFKNLFEVGIGTGWPIAATISKNGFNISGADIAAALIEKCNRDWPDIQAEVADAVDLHYSDSSFDLTYCFHSSWYFSDLPKAISEMCRVTCSNGYVLIDVMNLHNPDIEQFYVKQVFENTKLLGKVFKTIKNLAKFLLRRGIQDWPFLISWTASDPIEIVDIVESLGGKGIRLYGWRNDQLNELIVRSTEKYQDYARVVICWHQ